MEQAQTRREGEVWKACDGLWARHGTSGQMVGDSIRDELVRLGFKKGSPNEIYKYRHSWKLSRGVRDTNGVQEPEVVHSDPITRAVSLVHEQLQANAKSQMEQQAKQHLDQVTELTSEKEQLGSQHQELRTKLTQVSCTVEQLTQDKSDLELKLRGTQASYEATQSFVANYERNFREISEQQSLQLAHLKEAYEQQLSSKNSDIGRLNELTKQIHERASEETSQLKVVVYNLEKQRDRALKQSQESQARLEENQKQLLNLGKENRRLQQDKEKFQRGLSHLQGELKALKKANAALMPLKKQISLIHTHVLGQRKPKPTDNS